MSTDEAACKALAVRTKAPIRYFELVNFTSTGHNAKCFLAVGKHALYLIRRNLGGLYPSEQGGQIYFAYIKSMVEDSENANDLLFFLSDAGARAWNSNQLYVTSENRHILAQRIQVAWSTDHIYRFGLVGHLPLVKHPLRETREHKKETRTLAIKPFRGCKEAQYHSYKFFIPTGYVKQEQEGCFIDPRRMLELQITVHESVKVSELEASNHGHIRWIALEYKQMITLPMNRVVVTKNGSYQKKMNLSSDICEWTGWEIALKSEDCAKAAVLLRRAYTSPLADSGQDFVISVRCPRWLIDEGKVLEQQLLHEARLIADSATPNTLNCTVPQTLYRDFIQAKLDALLYTEENIRWLDKTLGLRPACEREAILFVKSCLQVLAEENQLASPDLVKQVGKDVMAPVAPLSAANAAMRNVPRPGFKDVSQDNLPAPSPDDPAANAWLARVARYFAYCLDEVFLESQFSLYDMCSANLVAKVNQEKCHEALLFLLHVRPKDFCKPWEVVQLRHLLLIPEFFTAYEFNDRAMQAMLELGWIAKQFKPPKEKEVLSIELSQFIAKLLVSTMSSVNLKTAICRLIISACNGPMHVGVLVPALMSTLQQRDIHLKTYATVTFVNMTAQHELVKDKIIASSVCTSLNDHLQTRDDDLIFYTLCLTMSLSKTTSHRLELHRCGVVDQLLRLLPTLPPTPSKHRLIAEISGTLGQLCNEEEIWKRMCRERNSVVERLLELLKAAPNGSRMRQRVMFALRQFSMRVNAVAAKYREDIGNTALLAIIEELRGIVEHHGFSAKEGDVTDCAVSAVLLLSTLAFSGNLVEQMRQAGFTEILVKLQLSPLMKLEATRERLDQLWKQLAEVGDDKKGRAQSSSPSKS